MIRSFNIGFRQYVFVLFFFFWGLTPKAQTVGVVENGDDVSPGYVLFSPLTNSSTYLIDECGQVVREYSFVGTPGMMTKLTPSGDLVRGRRIGSSIFSGGGIGGLLEGFDWEGSSTFFYQLNDSTFHQHHDFEILPSGNILVLGWEYISAEEAKNNGRIAVQENGMYSERIIEIEPISGETFNIVWEWRAWDHLIQNVYDTLDNYGEPIDYPEKIDLNYTNNGSLTIPDWLHANSLDYNPQLDQIILNVRNFAEFWIIDHSTTIEESQSSEGGNAGKGGDVLYRWGNPESYGAGGNQDQVFFGQHDSHWIKEGLPGAGNILVFNNGIGKPEGNFSTIEEIIPPLDGLNYILNEDSYGPENSEIVYGESSGDNSFFSQRISGSQRLQNGNTIICVGNSGRFIEVGQDKKVQWKYVNPSGTFISTQGENPQNTSNSVFQIIKYPYDFSGFDGKELIAGEKIELIPWDNCNIPLDIEENVYDVASFFDNENNLLKIENNGSKKLELYIYTVHGIFVEKIDIDSYEILSHSCNYMNSSVYVAVISQESEPIKTIKFAIINE